MGEVVTDHEAGLDLLDEAWAQNDFKPTFEVNVSPNPPENKDAWGYYQLNDETIYLNAKTIRKTKDPEDRINRTLLHEIGHAHDHASGTFDYGSNLFDFGYFGGQIGGISFLTGLATEESAERISNIPALAGVSFGALLTSSAMFALIDMYLDKKQLRPEPKNEAYANAFRDKYFDRYPRILRLVR